MIALTNHRFEGSMLVSDIRFTDKLPTGKRASKTLTKPVLVIAPVGVTKAKALNHFKRCTAKVLPFLLETMAIRLVSVETIESAFRKECHWLSLCRRVEPEIVCYRSNMAGSPPDATLVAEGRRCYQAWRDRELAASSNKRQARRIKEYVKRNGQENS